MTPVTDDALLLRLESPAADQLLRRLLTNESIQQSLKSNFGIASSTLTTLLKAPLQIRLTPVSRGPFQAVLHMNLRITMPRAHLASTLNRVGKALEERGMVRQVVDVINPDGHPPVKLLCGLELMDHPWEVGLLPPRTIRFNVWS